jgi:hypothetical protein
MPVIAFLPAGWLTDHLIASAVITVGISVILAALSWTLFEDPIRRHGVVAPVKNWLAQWRHDRAVPVAAQGRLRRYAGAGAGVVMTAVLAIGAPPCSPTRTVRPPRRPEKVVAPPARGWSSRTGVPPSPTRPRPRRTGPR